MHSYTNHPVVDGSGPFPASAASHVAPRSYTKAGGSHCGRNEFLMVREGAGDSVEDVCMSEHYTSASSDMVYPRGAGESVTGRPTVNSRGATVDPVPRMARQSYGRLYGGTCWDDEKNGHACYDTDAWPVAAQIANP